MADDSKPRTNLKFAADLQHVEAFHPDGSVEEAAALFTENDPTTKPVRNVLVRLSTDDPRIQRWIADHPGRWQITLTPPKS